MSFSPILSNQPLSYAENRSQYRNAPRENAWSSPVFACGPDTPISGYISYPGPKYQYGYNYYNSPATNKGNCTWWCWCRCLEANGTQLSLHLGDAKNWYDNYGGSKDRNANNIQAGDIIVLTDNDAGHVMFVEMVSGSTVYISQSAYSTRAVWNDKSCLVTSFDKSEIYQGSSINMYKNLDTPAYETVVGVIHTGGGGSGGRTPTITIVPANGEISVGGYIQIEITAEYIDASDSDPYPTRDQSSGLSREWVSQGWQVTTYTEDGVTYQRTYGVMNILASAGATNPGWVKFYHTFVNGYAEATGYYNIIDDETELLITVFKKKKKVKEYMIKLI